MVSTGAQDLPLRTRVGSMLCSNVREPSTFTNVCDHSVRSARISTRRPHVPTIRPAESASGCSSSQATADFGAAASTRVGATSADVTNIDTNAAIHQRRAVPMQTPATRPPP
ncbi:hypothetical protein D0Q02_29400 [Micromonospora craniellae]|uniref:Uncharacterized protein n=1 Tax=Micromonospora craniellae TaxID=2294034 RepID=A0A372FQW7_9ACTN|nr:hypothetical protein D0Q02_29400 [Micromonospora craniellae]